MRVIAGATIVLALAACQREPSFDERYGETANEIQERGRAIEREVEQPANDADAPSGGKRDGDEQDP